MNRLFGAKKEEPQRPPEPPKELPKPVDLTAQAQKMDAKVKDLNDNITQIDKEIAKYYQDIKNAKTKTQQNYLKQRLVMVIKRKKMLQQQMDNYMGQQMTLDQIAFTKDNIQNTLDMGRAMKEATTMQKEMMKGVNIDELEDIRDEMEEMTYQTNEINEMLNRNWGMEVNEAEIEQELRDLDSEYFVQQLNAGDQQKNEVPSYLSELAKNKQTN
eukprot:TRINITY_DN19467_c0_g1_i1.p1 TRINITY_DN19467_c0_g1~~TRINITY_DN19467_c0_g1_i1.p1  ORF type:complete len:214 (+),score=84.74 TRINITY_DN19467_c0_g1_i1:132-773(+)